MPRFTNKYLAKLLWFFKAFLMTGILEPIIYYKYHLLVKFKLTGL